MFQEQPQGREQAGDGLDIGGGEPGEEDEAEAGGEDQPGQEGDGIVAQTPRDQHEQGDAEEPADSRGDPGAVLVERSGDEGGKEDEPVGAEGLVVIGLAIDGGPKPVAGRLHLARNLQPADFFRPERPFAEAGEKEKPRKGQHP
jgi:hypothetical protein